VTEAPDDAWALLKSRLTDTRRAKMEAVAAQRTRHIRLVVQDVHQPHNVSACMRSADAFGVDTVDVVTLSERFKPSTVARGVSGWLTIHRHKTVKDCVAALRAGGYRIVAGLPRQDSVSLYELPVAERLAVVFGNEHAGIDQEWLAHVDHPFTIPMVGMVESLNISVSAAITLAHLTRTARAALADRYALAPAEQAALLNRWIVEQVPSWEGELARARART
jgi:tRNA (guanosine-2'-O-)-methyltransferase